MFKRSPEFKPFVTNSSSEEVSRAEKFRNLFTIIGEKLYVTSKNFEDQRILTFKASVQNFRCIIPKLESFYPNLYMLSF